MNANVSSLIVTYNCGEKVIPTFQSVLPQVEKVLVIDNGSRDETLAVLEELRRGNPGAAEVIALGRNEGLARALNVGVRRAKALGFHWVLTMDHDSIADGQMVRLLLEAVARQDNAERVAVCAPLYIDRGDEATGRLYRYDGWRRMRLDPLGPGQVLEPTVVITSGNLLNTDLHERLGGFDESLFIDYVDHDFCLRARDAGFSVIAVTDARLYHSVGDATSVRLFGFSWFSTNHPASRRYTIGRNRMTMVRRYWRRFPAYAFWTAIGFGFDLLGILLCERGKRDKIRMMARGARDSWRLGTG